MLQSYALLFVLQMGFPYLGGGISLYQFRYFPVSWMASVCIIQIYSLTL